MQPPLDREMIERAERFECYCGRSLDVGAVIVCGECRRPPAECTCEELDDGEGSEDDEAAGCEDGRALEEDGAGAGAQDRHEQEAEGVIDGTT